MKLAFAVLLSLLGAGLEAANLELRTRSRIESGAKGSGEWQIQEKTLQWAPEKTALIICDMWDKHWCEGATARVGEMAPRMNEVIKAARAKGVFIIHAPSDTMSHYEGWPQRKRAQEAPKSTPPVPLKNWCHLDPAKEAPLPIDDSDGGCDEDPQCKNYKAWSRQIPILEIAPEDAITDSAEAYNLLQQRGIENVIVMGVHANMCVLGRPFSIRQMVGVGKNVVLMRDMTDTMYNSRRRPFVSHFRGTDLIVEHIERYWCPSITSVDFLGGEPFRFSKDPENPVNKPRAEYAPPAAKPEDQKGPLAPQDSLKAFTVFNDLEISEVLAEPVVRQPLHLSWDQRGRLWVVQYIQYPAPAGLALISKDQFWRAVYDKVPPPPPKHFKGEDKITIHEDTDGDGKLDKHKTFVEGLNIVTAVEHDKEGVWVLNPPYLLYFPDKNHDDVVDGDPEVHLAGFGLEDTHSVANSLRWGPDGWLYGAHGSTVTANIIRPGIDTEPIARMMGQHIWRYQPQSKRFEIFAEGGGNAFGLEIDDKGRIFSGHNGGNTRGFHYVQGGYLQKGFEKHGQLGNPYAFGYFRQMAHNDVERFTHTFVIYGGGALPEKYDGRLFGIEPLQGRVVMSEITPDRSSFKTKDLGHAVVTSDRYFKPVDIKTGPDGALYIADWYDRQVTHTRNYEGNIDKSNGRIYRLAAKSPKSPARSGSLVMDVSHPNRWVRQNTQRGLQNNDAQIAQLREISWNGTGQSALEALWGLHRIGGLTEATAAERLKHRDPHVRLWTVRLVGDQSDVTDHLARKLIELSASEPHVEVRSQLASTARRLPAAQGLAIVRNLMTHHEDAEDIHVPLLLWWAIEAKAESDRAAVLDFYKQDKVWQSPFSSRVLAERIMKRYAMAGSQADLRSCAALLDNAPPGEKPKLVAAFEDAFKGRALPRLPMELQEAIAAAGGGSVALSVRRGDAAATAEAIALVQDVKSPAVRRVELIQALGDVRAPEAEGVLLKLATTGESEAVRGAAASALQVYESPMIGRELLAHLRARSARPPPIRIMNLLATREVWAEQLLDAVEKSLFPPEEVPPEIVEKLRSYNRLETRSGAVWGARKSLTTEIIDQTIARYTSLIQSGSGSPFEGQKHFNMACGSCHKLFGQGGEIGPDLTSFKRDDLQSMLMSIVNPTGEIREGYENVVIETKDGRNLTGFLAERYEDNVVLRGLDGESTVIAKKNLAQLKSAGASLMPEGLLEAFNEQQVRDLFAYLRSTQPLVKQ